MDIDHASTSEGLFFSRWKCAQWSINDRKALLVCKRHVHLEGLHDIESPAPRCSSRTRSAHDFCSRRRLGTEFLGLTKLIWELGSEI